MPLVRRNRAFTLIEVLVVLAIIALLAAILIPSLDAAKKQARSVTCQANIRSVMTAFLTYASETKGYLPGLSEDPEADWLGQRNTNKVNPGAEGRQPEDGTLFKYMGKQKLAYRCPDDDQYRNTLARNNFHSYTTCTLLSGANTANVGQSHYRFGTASTPSNFSETDHKTNMRVAVAMVIVEEDYQNRLFEFNNSAWDNDDSLTERHPRKRGNVGCIDGHVQALSLPTKPRTEGKFFGSMDQCVRYRKKWVSGRSWTDFVYGLNGGRGAYRFIEQVKPAEEYGVQHQ